MNILIVVPWDQSSGGVASVVGNLGKYLQGRGHKVFFLHPDRSALFLRRGTTRWGFNGYKLRLGLPFSRSRWLLSTLAFPLLFPLAMFELARLIRRHRIQVINIHYPNNSFVYFALCRIIPTVKLVTSIHGADIFPGGKSRRSYSAWLRLLLRCSDLVVANSRAFQDDFLRLFPNCRDKTTFIHNGVDIAELNKPEKNGYQKNGRRYALSIAMHNEKKGLDVLIRAFSRIAESEPHLEIVLVGDGPMRAGLEQLAKILGVDSRVKFLGRQQRPQIAKLLRGCDIFVHPAVAEPFGIAILEALSCRRPVVASNTGGIPEIIQNGVNGILVEPKNPAALAGAIANLLHDKKLSQSLSEHGYSTVVERFQWEHTCSAYESQFKHLLAAPSDAS